MSELRGKLAVVLGGAGFVGSALVRQLLDAGAVVNVVDNISTGRSEHLEACFDNDRLNFFVDDIRHINNMRMMIDHANIVYHLATTQDADLSPFELHEVNVTATLSLLKIAREVEVGRVVYVSTAQVYASTPQRHITEQDRTHPASLFAASQLAAEAYVQAFAIPATVLRLFKVYGPRSLAINDPVTQLMQQARAADTINPAAYVGLAGDFSYVEDVARGIMRAGLVDAAIGETINIGSGQGVHLNESILRQLHDAQHIPKPTIANGDWPQATTAPIADITRARDLLGYSASTPLLKGLQHLLTWLEAQAQKANLRS